MNKGCVVGCLVAVVVIVVICICGLHTIGGKIMDVVQEGTRFKDECKQLFPIIAECNPEELKQYSADPDANYSKFCNLLKGKDDKVVEIGSISGFNYKGNSETSADGSKTSFGSGSFDFTIKYTSSTKKITAAFVDTGSGPKIESLDFYKGPKKEQITNAGQNSNTKAVNH